FRRKKDGTIVAKLGGEERELLASLAGQVSDLLSEPVEGDPAITRLLPNAYPHDDEAAAEFRRFTESELVDRKLHNAATVVASLEGWPVVELDPPTALAWLRALTDIRIALAARLGIVLDEDDGDVSTDEGAMMRDVYDWLGYLQGALVEAVDR
ncbi:MAG: DUF2017 domain-containing protein, partial [Rhodoglobus sp.]